jgi:hypothetical protein
MGLADKGTGPIVAQPNSFEAHSPPDFRIGAGPQTASHQNLMWVAACLMIHVTKYDISDAVSFILPNHADDALKKCYPKSYDKLSPVQ